MRRNAQIYQNQNLKYVYIISKDKYENHIHNLCSNKPEKIKIEKKIENIDDITKNENINQKVLDGIMPLIIKNML